MVQNANDLGPSDCGSLAFTNEQVREALKKRQPDDKNIDTTDFGTITE